LSKIHGSNEKKTYSILQAKETSKLPEPHLDFSRKEPNLLVDQMMLLLLREFLSAAKMLLKIFGFN